MSTVTEIAAEIARRKQELAELEKQLEKAKTEPEDISLARQLHSMLCQLDHTDANGCSWYYEMFKGQDSWHLVAHGQYLGKARRLMHSCKEKAIGTQFAIEVFKMVKE